MDYGQWAGLFDTEVARRWPVAYQQWRHDPYSVEIPGGESAVELRDRISAALRTVLSSHTDGDAIAFVSHQVVTKTLVCILLGLPNTAYWSVRQDLCNLTCFDYNPGNDEVTLVGLNDTYHLGPTLPRASGSGTGIVLIRHGQTAWNVGAGEERFRGRTDLPLDATGHTQARAVASRLGRERPAALFASPLLRTQQTMAPLAQELGLPVQVHESLLDINYGKFQGMTHSEAAVAYPEHYTLWWTRPSLVRFPGGESLVDVQTRLLALLQELAARYPDQTIFLVGHQIVNKVLACTLLGLDLDHIWHIQQDTCGLDVFQQTDDNWQSLCINGTGHLH
jgi:probable phosphoglycerate mutase